MLTIHSIQYISNRHRLLRVQIQVLLKMMLNCLVDRGLLLVVYFLLMYCKRFQGLLNQDTSCRARDAHVFSVLIYALI